MATKILGPCNKSIVKALSERDMSDLTRLTQRRDKIILYDRILFEDEELIAHDEQFLRPLESIEGLPRQWLLWKKVIPCCVIALTLGLDARVRFGRDFFPFIMAWTVLVLSDFQDIPTRIDIPSALDALRRLIVLSAVDICQVALIEILGCGRKFGDTKLSIRFLSLILLAESSGFLYNLANEI